MSHSRKPLKSQTEHLKAKHAEPDSTTETSKATTPSGERAQPAETHRFTTADGTSVLGTTVEAGTALTGEAHLGRNGVWKSEALSTRDALDVVVVGQDHWIVASETGDRGGLEFHAFLDRDGDGLWTEVARGEVAQAALTVDGKIDLVGMIQAGTFQGLDGLVS